MLPIHSIASGCIRGVPSKPQACEHPSCRLTWMKRGPRIPPLAARTGPWHSGHRITVKGFSRSASFMEIVFHWVAPRISAVSSMAAQLGGHGSTRAVCSRDAHRTITPRELVDSLKCGSFSLLGDTVVLLHPSTRCTLAGRMSVRHKECPRSQKGPGYENEYS